MRQRLGRRGAINRWLLMPLEVPCSPSQDLTGRRALITGGGRGIGFAAAAALAQAGAEVTLMARSETELEQAATALTESGAHATALPMDVTDTEKARRSLAALPPFQILVNNAGTNFPAPFLEVTEEDFDKMFRLNVRAAFFLAQLIASRLVAESLPGSIINMSSQMGHVGGSERTVYCATKHAMEGFTKAMAVELAPHRVRVNSICPTFIETDLVRPMLKDKSFHQQVLAKIPLGRLGQVEDLMGAVVFLASDASALMTGSALMLDGGWTAS